MVYSQMLRFVFCLMYGEPADASSDCEPHGLVLVADGVGGLDLCGTGLRYVVGAQKLPFEPDLAEASP